MDKFIYAVKQKLKANNKKKLNKEQKTNRKFQYNQM